MEPTYYIKVAIVLIMIFVFISAYNKKLNKKINEKKIQKLKLKEAKIKLEQAKIKEDFELSLQKEVKCEDGKIRIYKDSMLGILSDCPTHLRTGDGEKHFWSFFPKTPVKSVMVDEILVKKSDFEMMNFKTDNQFDLNITTLDWFSEEGEKLNFEEVINAKNNWHKLNNEYALKYISLMWRNISIAHVSYASKKIEELVIINDFVFIKKPFKPFYGLIDNVKYVNGQKII